MDPNIYTYLKSSDQEMFYLGCILFVQNMQDITDYSRLKDHFVYKRIGGEVRVISNGRYRFIKSYLLTNYQRREILREAQAKHLQLLKKLKNEKE